MALVGDHLVVCVSGQRDQDDGDGAGVALRVGQVLVLAVPVQFHQLHKASQDVVQCHLGLRQRVPMVVLASNARADLNMRSWKAKRLLGNCAEPVGELLGIGRAPDLLLVAHPQVRASDFLR